jgi:hypothetical protein
MRLLMIVLLLAGGLAACTSSRPSASGPTSTITSASDSPTAPAPRFDVVLDDHGVTFPPGKTPARTYRISFEDRRTSPPPGQKLYLQFVVAGPQILLVDVPAGASSTHALLANMTPEIVFLDPGVVLKAGDFLRPDDLAHRHALDVPVTNPVEIEATPEFPTPVT